MDVHTIIEALITASSEPLAVGRIVELIHEQAAEIAGAAAESEAGAGAPDPGWVERLRAVDAAAVEEAIGELNRHYAAEGRSFQLLERSAGWKLYTRPEYAGFVARLFPGRRSERLSGPAMETLAIIAYRQPITKAAIEAVRGVGCDAMLQKLLDRELVRIAGRAELPGRPLLYATTEVFFEHFGIRSIDDLPNARELRKARLPEAPAGADAAPPDEPRQLTLAEAAMAAASSGGPESGPGPAAPAAADFDPAGDPAQPDPDAS